MTSWFSAPGGEVDLYMCEMEAGRVHARARAPPASKQAHAAECNIGLMDARFGFMIHPRSEKSGGMFCAVKVNQWDFFSGGNLGRVSGLGARRDIQPRRHIAPVWGLHPDVLSFCFISAAYLPPCTCKPALRTHGIAGGSQVHA